MHSDLNKMVLPFQQDGIRMFARMLPDLYRYVYLHGTRILLGCFVRCLLGCYQDLYRTVVGCCLDFTRMFTTILRGSVARLFVLKQTTSA